MKKILFFLLICFASSCIGDKIDPNAILLVQTHVTDGSGNESASFYEYDSGRRLVKIMAETNNQLPAVVKALITYTGNEAILNIPNLSDPLLDITTEVKLTLDGGGAMLQRIEH